MSKPSVCYLPNKSQVRICILLVIVLLVVTYAYLIISLPYRVVPQKVLERLREIPFIEREIGQDAFWWFNLSMTKKGRSLLLLNGDLKGALGTGDVVVKAEIDETGDGANILSVFLFKGEKCFLSRQGKEFRCTTKRIKRRGRR